MAQNENGNKHPMLFGSSSEILSPEAQKEPQQPPNILLWYSYAEPPHPEIAHNELAKMVYLSMDVAK